MNEVLTAIGFIALFCVFFGLCIGAPLLLENSMEHSLLFRAKDAYDAQYDGEYLTFKTKDKNGEYCWRFKGDCTVWYWKCLYKGRCSTLYEYELHQIWEDANKISVTDENTNL